MKKRLLCVVVLYLGGCNTGISLTAPSRALCTALPDDKYQQLVGILQGRKASGATKEQLLGETPGQCNPPVFFNTSVDCETCIKAILDEVYAQ